MSSRADVRVRLTAEGVAEVVAALRHVQQQANAANRNTVSSLGAATGALRAFRSVLGALGVATSAAALIGFARSSFRTATEVINLSRQLGVSTEEFSRLVYWANSADVELGEFSSGLAFYQRRLSEAISGNREAANSFRQIGLEARDLQNLPLNEQLRLIADRVRALGRAEDRVRASTDLFGRAAGTDLARALAQGAEGITRLEAEADRLGVTLSGSTAEAIDHTDAAIKRLKASASSLGRETLAGLSILLLGPPDEVQRIDEEIEKLRRRRDELLRISGESLVFGFRNASDVAEAEIAKIDAEINKALKRQRELLGLDSSARPTGEKTGGTLVDIETPEELKARLDRQRAAIQAELKLTEERIKAQEAADERAFERGLISLEEYIARRRALIQAGNDAEIAALRRQIEIIEATEPQDDADKIRQAAEVEKLRAEISLRRLQTENALAALADEQIDKQRELAREQIEVQNTLDQLEGRRHEVFLRNLEEELRQLRELLRQAGASTAEIDAAAERLTRARTAAFEFEEARRRGQQALDAFNRDAEQIRRDQEAGIISQIQGEDRLIELERQRLEVLRQLSAELQRAAEATNDPEQIEQALRFSDSVREIEASFRSATDVALQYQQAISEGFRSGIEDILRNKDEIDSIGDAFRRLGDTVLNVLNDITAKIVAKSLTRGLENLLGLGGGSAGGGAGSASGGLLGFLKLFGFGQRGGLVVQRKAAGDVVVGPKLPIPGPDKIPTLLEEGEFVVRRKQVARPGALAALRAFNAGLLSPTQLAQIPRFQRGGLVSAVSAFATRLPDGPARGARPGVHIDRLTVEAPTPELGRRAASQIGAELSRVLARDNARNN